MTIAIGLVLVAAAGVFVAAPFFTVDANDSADANDNPGSQAAASSDREKLERQKRDAYAAIKEAEFDYRMAKLSDSDFAALRKTYEAKAIAAIAALDAAKDQEQERSADSSQSAPVAAAFCPGCGQRLASEARFCAMCGQSLEQMRLRDAS
jgi:hypothetical protein